ncbi:MAG: hypothetical protein M3541_11940 [Acidobacteriota bacterium]|jgi:plasmid stability protein|nr:hypothetical protein [Acidobacteriota bacterium]
MADPKVRQLDERVARVRKTRAATRGVSLEEESPSTLSASVAAKRDAFGRRAAALPAASAKNRAASSDTCARCGVIVMPPAELPLHVARATPIEVTVVTRFRVAGPTTRTLVR